MITLINLTGRRRRGEREKKNSFLEWISSKAIGDRSGVMWPHHVMNSLQSGWWMFWCFRADSKRKLEYRIGSVSFSLPNGTRGAVEWKGDKTTLSYRWIRERKTNKIEKQAQNEPCYFPRKSKNHSLTQTFYIPSFLFFLSYLFNF